MLDNFWKLSTKFLNDLAPSDGRARAQPVAFPFTVRCFGREEEYFMAPGPVRRKKRTRRNPGRKVGRRQACGEPVSAALCAQKE